MTDTKNMNIKYEEWLLECLKIKKVNSELFFREKDTNYFCDKISKNTTRIGDDSIFGRVFLLRDGIFSCAVKVIPCKDFDTLRKIEDEININKIIGEEGFAPKIFFRSVCKITDVVNDKSRFYKNLLDADMKVVFFCMELMDISLVEILKTDISEHDILLIIFNIIEKITDLYEKGYTHKDLHCGNIMFKCDKLYIIDFGKSHKHENNINYLFNDIINNFNTIYGLINNKYTSLRNSLLIIIAYLFYLLEQKLEKYDTSILNGILFYFYHGQDTNWIFVDEETEFSDLIDNDTSFDYNFDREPTIEEIMYINTVMKPIILSIQQKLDDIKWDKIYKK